MKMPIERARQIALAVITDHYMKNGLRFTPELNDHINEVAKATELSVDTVKGFFTGYIIPLVAKKAFDWKSVGWTGTKPSDGDLEKIAFELLLILLRCPSFLLKSNMSEEWSTFTPLAKEELADFLTIHIIPFMVNETFGIKGYQIGPGTPAR
jgi:hypothetical protein